jgi:cell shape-determining protein MreD
MFSRLGLALLIYVAAVLETSARLTPTGRIAVCWLCLTALASIWTMSAGEAAGWGALIGLVGDSIAAGPLGLQILGFSTLGFVLAMLRVRWECRSLAALTLFAMVQTAGIMGLVALAAPFLSTPSANADAAYLIVGCSAATGIGAAVMVALWRTLRAGLVSLIVAQRV